MAGFPSKFETSRITASSSLGSWSLGSLSARSLSPGSILIVGLFIISAFPYRCGPLCVAGLSFRRKTLLIAIIAVTSSLATPSLGSFPLGSSSLEPIIIVGLCFIISGCLFKFGTLWTARVSSRFGSTRVARFLCLFSKQDHCMPRGNKSKILTSSPLEEEPLSLLDRGSCTTMVSSGSDT